MKRSRPPAFGEREAIRLLARRLTARSRDVRIGIGDDAAVLAAPRESLVWTVDSCLEGAHFERGLLTLEDVGFRSLQAAASDLAAMGARPVGALVALELPAGFSRRELDALARGQAQASRSLGCPVVGGNLARGGRLGVTTTVLGAARRPLTRSGSRPGDELWLTGAVGLAAAGLSLLRSRARVGDRAARRAVLAWRRPRALVGEGLALAGRADAAIDVSDGLGGDAGHLAEGSEVQVVIEEAALLRALRPELRRVAERVHRSPLELALSGGEDYALLSTGRLADRPPGARRIGRVVTGRGAVLERLNGSCSELGAGYDHLS